MEEITKNTCKERLLNHIRKMIEQVWRQPYAAVGQITAVTSSTTATNFLPIHGV